MKTSFWHIGPLAAILLTAATALADDWRQWRGPYLNGSSDETNLPVSFSWTENVAWTARLPGTSGATPIVLADRVFVSSTVRGSRDLVGLCYRAKDGEFLWRRTLGRAAPIPRTDLASPSPVTDGERVYFTYGSGEMAGLDLDGKVLWTRNLTKEYGCLAIMFGFASTPLLYEGKLLLPVLRREKPYRYNVGANLPRRGPFDSFLLALDPKTGKTLYRHVRETDAVDESREAYITPSPCEAGGRKQVILNGGTYVTSHDPATGRELWRWPYKTTSRPTQQRVISSVVVGEGLIFAPHARKDTGVIALDPGLSGRVPHERFLWRFNSPTPDASTPLVYRGLLYVLAGDSKVMTCLEPKTGKVKWQKALDGAGPYRASPTGADGKIHCLSEGGDVVILAAGGKFRELFRFSLASTPSRSSIVAARGSLFIRTADRLLCLRKPGPGP
jgi:outer membrane protein assembly factor BamB